MQPSNADSAAQNARNIAVTALAPKGTLAPVTNLPQQQDAPASGLFITLESFADMDWDIPTWAWEPEHNGNSIGSIPLGAMTMFAGRPGAGKSSAGRYFAAQVTRGTLPGCWRGTPQKVAYLAGEESLKYNVLPGLIAAGADPTMMVRPKATFVTPDGKTEIVGIVPDKDMRELADRLIQDGVKLVIIDPLMEYMGTDIDVYKNNEVRAKIKPWAKLAEDIDGVVIAIMHLNKSGNGDVVAGINGSSAFGEVARAVFGFAIDPDDEDGDRIMSQEKNSIGTEGSAWVYRMEGKLITNAEGKTGDFGTFQMIGDSDRTVGEVLRDSARGNVDDRGNGVKEFVLDFMASKDGVAAAAEVRDAVTEAGYAWKTVQNNRRRWGVETRQQSGGWKWIYTPQADPEPPADPTSTSRTHGNRDLGPEQVSPPKSDPERGQIPDPAHIETVGADRDETQVMARAAVLEALADYPQTIDQIKKSVTLRYRDQAPNIIAQEVTADTVYDHGDGTYSKN